MLFFGVLFGEGLLLCFMYMLLGMLVSIFVCIASALFCMYACMYVCEYCFCFVLYVSLYVILCMLVYAGCEGAGSFAGARCSLAIIYITYLKKEASLSCYHAHTPIWSQFVLIFVAFGGSVSPISLTKHILQAKDFALKTQPVSSRKSFSNYLIRPTNPAELFLLSVTVLGCYGFTVYQ